MPDANKFAKLREIGYRIPVTCGLCKWSKFVNGQMHGSCSRHLYQHLKHDNPDQGRPISVVQAGSCPEGEMEQGSAWAKLSAHAEFLEKK